MKWEAPSISRFASDAGFAGRDLHVATAIALACSGGVDTFDCRVGYPGTGRYVGLWGVNVDHWTDYEPGELAVPARAAQVAHELTQRVGGFGWSAAWRAGSDRRHYAAAATASTRLPWTEREHHPIGTVLAQHRIDDLARQWRKRFARGR